MKFQIALALIACSVAATEDGWAKSACPDLSETEHFDTPQYQAMSAACKQANIWKKVQVSNKYERFFVGKDLEKLFNEDFNMNFDNVSDTRPYESIQRVDPKGCVSKAEFIPTHDTPYTGIFQGAKSAILRISEFTQTTPEVPKTSPGASIKFLRDGMSSGNLITRFAYDGQPSYNFFKNRYTNILREPQNECLRMTYGKLCADATDHIGARSVMELAQFDQHGDKVAKPHWPFMIDLEPYDVYGWTDAYENDFNDQLEKIEPNTSMFKVFAYDEPPELGGKDTLIGWIVSRSKNVTSKWGDQKLFFQHRRYEDDIKERPIYYNWLQHWSYGNYRDSGVVAPAPLQKCPFFFLYEEAGLA